VQDVLKESFKGLISGLWLVCHTTTGATTRRIVFLEAMKGHHPQTWGVALGLKKTTKPAKALIINQVSRFGD